MGDEEHTVPRFPTYRCSTLYNKQLIRVFHKLAIIFSTVDKLKIYRISEVGHVHSSRQTI